MKNICFAIIGLFFVSCAYQPQGMVSKVDPQTYKVEFTGSEEKLVKETLHQDAKGICNSEKKTKYYKVVNENIENTGLRFKKKTGGISGALKAVGNLAMEIAEEDDWKGSLEFQCQ